MSTLSKFEIENQVLHSKFDIEIHKRTFIDYLEVIILENGTIEYAIPSHQEKLIQIICDKENKSREEVINDSSDHVFDFSEWLCKTSGCISVWNDFYHGSPNKIQLEVLYKLKDAKLYKGELNYNKNITNCYSFNNYWFD